MCPENSPIKLTTKPSLDPQHNELQAISSLSFLSKLAKRVVVSILSDYLTANNLVPTCCVSVYHYELHC